MNFDEASNYFDLYVDWERRLRKEMPYLITRIEEGGGSKVADVACGSGMHAVALAQNGFDVVAVDASKDLLRKARDLAEEKQVAMTFEQALFSDLPGEHAGRIDAAVCLGNSLSLVPPGDELESALHGMARLLKTNGILIAHTLNYPRLAARGNDPWGPVRALDDETLLMKGFIPRPSGPWDAQFIHVEKRSDRKWISHPVRFQVFPHTVSELTSAAGPAGLKLRAVSGGFEGQSVDEPNSADLVYEFELN